MRRWAQTGGHMLCGKRVSFLNDSWASRPRTRRALQIRPFLARAILQSRLEQTEVNSRLGIVGA